MCDRQCGFNWLLARNLCNLAQKSCSFAERDKKEIFSFSIGQAAA